MFFVFFFLSCGFERQIRSFLASLICFPNSSQPVGPRLFSLCQIWPQIPLYLQPFTPPVPTPHRLLLQPHGTICISPNKSWCLCTCCSNYLENKIQPKHHLFLHEQPYLATLYIVHLYRSALHTQPGNTVVFISVTAGLGPSIKALKNVELRSSHNSTNCYHLPNIYYVLSPVPSIPRMLPHFTLKTTL